MKILKERPWIKQYECTGHGNGDRGCGSELEVGKEDLRYFAKQVYSWRTQPEAVCFKCPVCNAVTDIEKKDWPPSHTKLPKWTKSWQEGSENNDT